MYQASTIEQLRNFLNAEKSAGKTIGFVPTMGALHQGHISLISKAKEDCDVVVCSIFVNPTQFNDPNDLKNYPRTPAEDQAMLEEAGCHCLFTPAVNEMYPEPEVFKMDFGPLERVMEGQFRPGHFKGVAMVVSRFFTLVEPDFAYFGEKDFQQLAIIREMNRRMGFNTTVVGCPTLRENDGLAMSSRNIHLTPEERKAAPVIYESLMVARSLILEKGLEQARRDLTQRIESKAGFRVQYLEFVDSVTLQPISLADFGREQRTCLAVLTLKTRLIDNAPL